VKKAAESGELGDVVVINLSGRGDKDVDAVAKMEGYR
jgi:tryptophan synthase beta chain